MVGFNKREATMILKIYSMPLIDALKGQQETLLKAEHQRGFIEGSDITGSMGVEICACKLHDQRKKYRAKIKTLKDANSEDNMISLEARLQKNDAYNECIKIIK